MSATDTTHIQNCPQVTECIVTDAQGMIDHERMHARERIRAADKAIARARGRIRANRGKIVEVEIKLERLAPLYRMEGRMVAEPNEMAEMKLRIEQYQMRIEYLGALIKTEKHFIKTTMRRMQADMDRM